MEVSLPSVRTVPTRAYRRCEPEHGVLHRVLSDHLSTFLAHIDEDRRRAGLPGRVRRELWSYLRCGILAHGFARVRCGKGTLVAFSCKGRGLNLALRQQLAVLRRGSKRPRLESRPAH